MKNTLQVLKRLAFWTSHATIAALFGFAFAMGEPPAPETPKKRVVAAAASSRRAAPPPPPPEKPSPPTRSQALDRLVAAYPDFLAGHDGTALLWRDGARMIFDDGREKTSGEKLELADLEDQLADPYPAGRTGLNPPKDFDPGRARHEPFFRKMYGDCKTEPLESRMVQVVWLPRNDGRRIAVTATNGVAERVRRISEELDALPKALLKHLRPPGGGYECRSIPGTARPSMRAYGAAVAINPASGDSWQDRRGGDGAYMNRVPWEIVEIFEKHGFIWGGKWSHFETAHFEYRPELLPGFDPGPPSAPPARPSAPTTSTREPDTPPAPRPASRPEPPAPPPAAALPAPPPADARPTDAASAPDDAEETVILPLPTRQPRNLR
ncbi:MAG: M15 family metallopeptidase [Hyphomicrobiales bacterium]|nr:M15 family metallopeptidase [Hyphomicrobiales bacterium]